MNEQKNVLIIGNGFDIALGYKTKYEDFLSYIIKANDSNLEDFIVFTKETWGIKDIDNEFLEAFYNNVKTEVKNNFIINYFLNYYIQTLTWADFEKELEHIGNCLEGLIIELQNADETDYFPIEIAAKNDLKHYYHYLQFLKSNEIFNLDFTYRLNTTDNQRIYFNLTDSFINKKLSTSCNLLKFIENIPGIFVDKLLNFASLFDVYLQIESKRKTGVFKPNFKFDELITYNYTDFCKQFVKKPFYINGKMADKSGANIIFGVDSGTNFRTQIFHQITKRIQRPSQGIQTSLISFYCHECDNLYIFGHSLAPADKDSLRLAFLEMQPRKQFKKIIIFYKSNQDKQKDLETKMNLSNNLKAILDDDFDDLISIVEFKDSKDFFTN